MCPYPSGTDGFQDVLSAREAISEARDALSRHDEYRQTEYACSAIDLTAAALLAT